MRGLVAGDREVDLRKRLRVSRQLARGRAVGCERCLARTATKRRGSPSAKVSVSTVKKEKSREGMTGEIKKSPKSMQSQAVLRSFRIQAARREDSSLFQSET